MDKGRTRTDIEVRGTIIVGIFENKELDKPIQTFLENATLSILNYILEDGIDGTLSHFSNLSYDDLKPFPHVAKALSERGLLK